MPKYPGLVYFHTIRKPPSTSAPKHFHLAFQDNHPARSLNPFGAFDIRRLWSGSKTAAMGSI